jgi:TPP-dependent pyruvate/acetoin dehydrogenase alpha subunit
MRDAGYRTPEEVAAWKARCPIKTFEEKLLTDRAATRGDLDLIDAEVKATIEEAAQFALRSPTPDPATVANHLYSTT